MDLEIQDPSPAHRPVGTPFNPWKDSKDTLLEDDNPPPTLQTPKGKSKQSKEAPRRHSISDVEKFVLFDSRTEGNVDDDLDSKEENSQDMSEGRAHKERKRSGKELWALLRTVWSRYMGVTGRLKSYLKAGLDAKETLETSESLSKHSSIQQQGNLELYDLKHLEERHKLLSHPLLKLWIDEHWARLDKTSEGEITKAVYCDLYLAFHRELLPEASLKEARKAVLKDWETDSQGGNTLDSGSFYLGFFELIDNWCDTTECREYVDVTKRLLQAAIATGAGVNVPPHGWYDGRGKKSKKVGRPASARQKRSRSSKRPWSGRRKKKEGSGDKEEENGLVLEELKTKDELVKRLSTPRPRLDGPYAIRQRRVFDSRFITWAADLSSIDLVKGYGAPKTDTAKKTFNGWGAVYGDISPPGSRGSRQLQRPQTAGARLGRSPSPPPVKHFFGNGDDGAGQLEYSGPGSVDTERDSATPHGTTPSPVMERFGDDNTLRFSSRAKRVLRVYEHPANPASPIQIRSYPSAKNLSDAAATESPVVSKPPVVRNAHGRPSTASSEKKALRVNSAVPPLESNVFAIDPVRFDLREFFEGDTSPKVQQKKDLSSPKSAFSPTNKRSQPDEGGAGHTASYEGHDDEPLVVHHEQSHDETGNHASPAGEEAAPSYSSTRSQSASSSRSTPSDSIPSISTASPHRRKLLRVMVPAPDAAYNTARDTSSDGSGSESQASTAQLDRVYDGTNSPQFTDHDGRGFGSPHTPYRRTPVKVPRPGSALSRTAEPPTPGEAPDKGPPAVTFFKYLTPPGNGKQQVTSTTFHFPPSGKDASTPATPPRTGHTRRPGSAPMERRPLGGPSDPSQQPSAAKTQRPQSSRHRQRSPLLASNPKDTNGPTPSTATASRQPSIGTSNPRPLARAPQLPRVRTLSFLPPPSDPPSMVSSHFSTAAAPGSSIMQRNTSARSGSHAFHGVIGHRGPQPQQMEPMKIQKTQPRKSAAKGPSMAAPSLTRAFNSFSYSTKSSAIKAAKAWHSPQAN